MEIKIKCEAGFNLPYSKLHDFQGELKTLSEVNYQKLRKEIETTGFAFAPHVWKNPKDNKYYLVDGHQRVKTVRKMVEEEKSKCPPLPCVIVQAKSYKEAKRRVLQAASQYGKVSPEGLKTFLVDTNFEIPDFSSSFVFPEINIPKFLNFFGGKEEYVEPEAEAIEVATLQAHPKNFRKYPEDLIGHLVESIKKSGVYRNIVVSSDNFILTGHGIFEAAKKMGLPDLPVIKVKFKAEDPKALKILINDNDLVHLTEVDDRLLCDVLKFIKDNDPEGLLGTGYNDQMLANLVFVTRPEAEIKDFNAASHWVGLPEYEDTDPTRSNEPVILIRFENAEDREKFVQSINLKIREKKSERAWSTIWPYQERNDLRSVKFEAEQ